MITTLCWLAWMWAFLSDDNKSTGLTILCWFAFCASLATS